MTDREALQAWPDPNELMFRKVEPNWSAEFLLSQQGWFPLADVMQLLDPHATGRHRRVLSRREKLINIGRDTVRFMGVRQFGSGFWANMAVFGQWYRGDEEMGPPRTPNNWELNSLHRQKGVYFA